MADKLSAEDIEHMTESVRADPGVLRAHRRLCKALDALNVPDGPLREDVLFGRYVDEFTFRLNDGNVKVRTLDRLDSFVVATAGKRITYKELTH